MRAASERQKSYPNLRRKDVEFSVGDRVFLKVLPWKKVLRFGCKGKLSLRFIGPYKILKRVGPVAYQLELLSKLDHFHEVFHVSMLRKYRSNLSNVISIKEVKVRPNISYEEEPIQILDREVKVLKKKKFL